MTQAINLANFSNSLDTSGGVPPTQLNAPVPISKGGTNGVATPTNGGVPYGTGTAYSFTSAGTAGQFLMSNGLGAPTWTNLLPTGTLMLFQQTAAPTGWTKQTTHDNKALRVVSGTASSGGTNSFTTVFTNQTPTITTSGLSVGATTLTTAQVPAHTHSYTAPIGSFRAGGGCGCVYPPTGSGGSTTGSAFTGGSHTHSISGSATSSAVTLAVQYVDLIIASKD